MTLACALDTFALDTTDKFYDKHASAKFPPKHMIIKTVTIRLPKHSDQKRRHKYEPGGRHHTSATWVRNGVFAAGHVFQLSFTTTLLHILGRSYGGRLQISFPWEVI